jgi:hypothetical protein
VLRAVRKEMGVLFWTMPWYSRSEISFRVTESKKKMVWAHCQRQNNSGHNGQKNGYGHNDQRKNGSRHKSYMKNGPGTNGQREWVWTQRCRKKIVSGTGFRHNSRLHDEIGGGGKTTAKRNL